MECVFKDRERRLFDLHRFSSTKMEKKADQAKECVCVCVYGEERGLGGTAGTVILFDVFK